MTALVKYSDVLYVQSSQTWDQVGQNYMDNRTQWSNLQQPSVTVNPNGFTIPGGATVASTDWTQDSGPNTLAIALQEPRAFCTKGNVSFTFTGTTLIVRLNTDWGWGTGHKVFIDGVAPLNISGILAGTNTLSCDSATYGLAGPAYVDVLIADGLSDTEHTVQIYVNKSGSEYFSLAGFKVAGFASRPLTLQGIWLLPASNELASNISSLTVLMKGNNTVLNAGLSFVPGLVDENAAALNSLAAATLNLSNPVSQQVLPNFTGNEISGTFTYPLTLTGQYADPAGTIVQTSTATIGATSAALIVGGSTWSVDNSTPTSVNRIFSNAAGNATNYLQFTFAGDALTITVEQDYGYGILGIYDSVSGTLLNSVTCSADQTQLFTTTLTGFGAGNHTVKLHKTTTDNSKYVIFVSASWTATETYTQITETVDLVMSASQPLALPVQGVTRDAYTLEFSPPVSTATQLDTVPVRMNSDIAYTEVLARFPTYAVCYQTGYADTLSQYDILIVDPFAAKSADVLAWQAMGIKVFGYISLGEEDGFYSNRYDFISANGPYVGDAGGPGGYASYYMKGGYQGRECTECTYDNQAVLGTKTCAQSQPMYYQARGRCGSACSFDSLNGYIAFSAGGACGAGFTSANFWVRPDANTACTNSACPSFKPVHQLQTGVKCPKYSQVDPGYMQDFSIANPNTPDQNGVWASYYTDSGKPSWLARIMSYYTPTVLGGPVTITKETVTVKSASTSGGTVLVFDSAHFPIDADEAITLTTLDGVTGVYANSADYSLDMKTGAFVFNSGITPAVTVGQQLLISYTKKGHVMDGIFMDTIDDADVYPLMGPLISTLVNTLKSNTGTKLISNRGFTNLNSYIHSCDGVMFESWLTDWNENTGAYFKVNDADSLEFNNGVNAQLQALRGNHVFDVYSLNYCDADATGDALRAFCTEEDHKRGYLSWTSTIDLNLPASNTNIPTTDQRITGGAFTRQRLKSY